MTGGHYNLPNNQHRAREKNIFIKIGRLLGKEKGGLRGDVASTHLSNFMKFYA